MISNILTLLLNDLAVAFKNKTLYLIIFIPFFVFLSLKLVDRPGIKYNKIRIGLIQQDNYPPVIIKSISSADELFTIFWAASEAEGKKWLKDKIIDGILLKDNKEPKSSVLIVLNKESFQTIMIVESLSSLQKSVEGSTNWISNIRSLHDSGMQKQILPAWILMLVLLVGFIILPVQVAEEKEKKILLGLLQTPMRETEWLFAKLFLGMILTNTAVILLHVLGGFDFGNSLSYFVFLGAGSFCFSSFGIFLGFLCRNQAGARTLGIIFYLPLLLPSALSDFSIKLNKVSPFLPSHQFFKPISSILLDGNSMSYFSLELVYLFFAGSLTFFLSYFLIKKRWLM